MTRQDTTLDGLRLSSTLGSITLLRLEAELRARVEKNGPPSRLPAFLGSTLRGAFGNALRRVSCALPRQRCETCMLKERCPYSYLFETPRPEGASERLRGQATLPHPLIIDPPNPRSEPYGDGDPLRFGMTLFGRGVDHLPYVVVALDQMARRGLGRDRSEFELVAIEALSADGKSSVVYRPGLPINGVSAEPLEDYLGRRSPEARVGVTFHTPTRLTADGRLTRRPGFHVLVRSLSIRGLAMLYYHCGADVDLDLEGLTSAASASEITSCDLRVTPLRRKSARQGKLVPLDGITGTVTYEGDSVAGLWPLLEAGELMRVGKGTVFGLGRYTIEKKDSKTAAERT